MTVTFMTRVINKDNSRGFRPFTIRAELIISITENCSGQQEINYINKESYYTCTVQGTHKELVAAWNEALAMTCRK